MHINKEKKSKEIMDMNKGMIVINLVKEDQTVKMQPMISRNNN